MNTKRTNLATMSLLLVFLLSAPAEARAFSVVSPAGLTVDDARLTGKPYVLWYEGPKTVELNDDVKAALSLVLRRIPEAQRPALVAVGDVSGYDYWPARSLAKRKLEGYERKYGHPIYGDWSGAMRDAFGLAKNQSNLLFVDARGEIRFQAVGRVSPSDTQRVEALIRGAK